ncbi:unnamed protein product [Hymenolepis diminuta]|uniref:Uncharacterized protein n=1 Tax=Hymenolepis diminuta TaxID=6216 RepID=A0A564ZB20_HYMDI|nr:unnamed protein product [Hymenolepis diminuta]
MIVVLPKLLWGVNRGRPTILYFQRIQPSIVHLHVAKGTLQPVQHFTCVIIGRMEYEQKVSSELGVVACKVHAISAPDMQQNHQNCKQVF